MWKKVARAIVAIARISAEHERSIQSYSPGSANMYIYYYAVLSCAIVACNFYMFECLQLG